MLKYLSHSKKGIRRDRNQDKIFIIDKENYILFCLFDGVSSIPTSHLFISQYIKRIKSKIKQLVPSGLNLPNILYESHQEAIHDDSKMTGMSTLSVLFYNKTSETAHSINIGDSRLYLFNNQFLEKVTIDDSLINTPNVLTKSLGSEEISLDDFLINDITSNYNFLICSDGFYKGMELSLMEYFEAFNFKKQINIRKKLSSLQKGKNNDDSSYILIKHEIPSRK